MKKRTKTLLTFLCAAALIAVSVIGTYAYLTASKTVTNTFTVGNVQIKLDEAKVNSDGKPVEGDDAGRTEEGCAYHLLPGHKYTKDPMVTVLKNSEACYIRMVVTITDIADVDTVFANHASEEGWTMESIFSGYSATNWESKGSVTNYNDNQEKVSRTFTFWYKGTGAGNDAYIHAKTTADTALDALFDELVIPGTITNTELESIKEMQIKIVAEAIQADGFTTAELAWAAFPTTAEP